MAFSPYGPQGNRFRQDLGSDYGKKATDAFHPDLNGADYAADFDYESLWICYSHENIAAASGKINPSSGGLDWTGCIDWDEDEVPFGHGSFGDVYQGIWKPLEEPDAFPPGVVVKVMRPQLEGDEREKSLRMKDLKKEVETWQSLRHKNIVPFVGYLRTFHGLPALISEYMPNGNIRTYLHNNPLTENRNEIMLGVAEGLNYLHSRLPRVIHGNLKADNVLLDDKLNPRLTDFGLNRMMATSTLWATSTKSVGGTLRWMAPELVNQDDAKPTAASDIYAFGLTCYEILVGKIPFYEIPEQLIAMTKYKFETPTMPEKPEVPSDLLEFWFECWDQSPILRPNSERVVEFLTDFANRSASSIHDESSDEKSEVGHGETEQLDVPLGQGLSQGSSRSALSSPSPAGIPKLEPRVPSRQDGRLSRSEMREPVHQPLLEPEREESIPESTPLDHIPNTFFSDIDWDITQSPRPLLAIASFDTKSSAFIPPLARCKIVCKGTPWKFEIKARRQQPHITIASLLNDVSAQLLRTVDIDIYRSHRSTEKKDDIMHAYLERCNNLPTHNERMAALSDWILRVDYFLNGTHFVAFEQDTPGGAVFNLITAPI